MPENADAMRVFHKVKYQLIFGPNGGALDIIHEAIWRMIDEFKIRKRMECFDKICLLAAKWWIPRMNEKKAE